MTGRKPAGAESLSVREWLRLSTDRTPPLPEPSNHREPGRVGTGRVDREIRRTRMRQRYRHKLTPTASTDRPRRGHASGDEL